MNKPKNNNWPKTSPFVLTRLSKSSTNDGCAHGPSFPAGFILFGQNIDDKGSDSGEDSYARDEKQVKVWTKLKQAVFHLTTNSRDLTGQSTRTAPSLSSSATLRRISGEIYGTS